MNNNKKNELCPCKKEHCPRNGKCKECKEFHKTTDKLPCCERDVE